MAKLVDALRADTRLILLGDPEQLSAVEAGNVLPALVAAASVEPFTDCHAALARSHRFGADTALGRLASAVVAGDADVALAVLDGGGDVRLANARDDGHPALIAQACAGYAGLLHATDIDAALRAARGFRVLTALRQGPQGCLALNRDIEARLVREHGLAAQGAWWRGRLVLVTANRPELGLFNGDIGIAWPDESNVTKVWFESADGPRPFAPAALPPHEGAFALTVHKAQGSEYPIVIAPVSMQHYMMLQRNLLYTCVTRAKRILVLVGMKSAIAMAVANNRIRKRNTRLAERLRNM